MVVHSILYEWWIIQVSLQIWRLYGEIMLNEANDTFQPSSVHKTKKHGIEWRKRGRVKCINVVPIDMPWHSYEPSPQLSNLQLTDHLALPQLV